MAASHLNLGLRWEYYGVQYSGDSSPESNFYLGAGPNFAQQIRNGQVLTVPNSPIHSLWRPDYHNFGPRIGFAWDIFGTGTTSLRGGYGISYERNFGKVLNNLTLNPPGYAFAEADARTPQFPTLNISTANLGPFAGTSGAITFPQSLARQVDANIKTAYAETWGLSADRQLLPNTVLSLSYSGSHGANYTWSHAIDNLSSTLSDYPNDFHVGFLDFLNPSLDRGDAEFDIRQRFVASAIWRSSFFVASPHRWERLILGGWSIAPIHSLHGKTVFRLGLQQCR